MHLLECLFERGSVIFKFKTAGPSACNDLTWISVIDTDFFIQYCLFFA